MSEDTVYSQAEHGRLLVERDRLRAERDELRAQRDAWLASIAAPGRGNNITAQMREEHRGAQEAREDAAIKARRDEAARLAEQRERAAVAEGSARLLAFEDESRARFEHNGGTPADFRAAWPRLRESWLTAQSASDPFERRVEEIAARMRASGAHRI